MRIGILGGTFDPVHLGHLILAEQAREQARLDEVRFLPTARHPLKDDQGISSFDRRAEMLELAIAGQPKFRVDRLEADRPGPSYTADTLDELRRREPRSEFFFLVGGDVLDELPRWYEPKRIVAAATLVVMERPGFRAIPDDELGRSIGVEPSQLRIQRIEVPAIDIASRDIRKRVNEGRSVRYLVPRAVEAYVMEKKLYV